MFESKVFSKDSTWDPHKVKNFLVAIPSDTLAALPNIPGWFDAIESAEESAKKQTEDILVDITGIENKEKTSKKAVSNADNIFEHKRCLLLTGLKANKKYKSLCDLREFIGFSCNQELKHFSSLPNIHLVSETLCLLDTGALSMEKDLNHTYTIEYKCMKENLKPVSSDNSTGLSENQIDKLAGIHSNTGLTLDIISKSMNQILEPKSNFELVLNKRSTTSGIELEISRSECHADIKLPAKSKEFVTSQNSALAVDLNVLNNESSNSVADKQKLGFDVAPEPSILSQSIPCGQPIPNNVNTTTTSCESDNNEEQLVVEKSDYVVQLVGADFLNAIQEKVPEIKLSKKRKHTREKSSKTSSSKSARKADIQFSFDELKSILDTFKLCFELLDS